MEIKKILCFCGSGLGTSFLMEMNVKKALEILRQAPGNKILYAAFETDLDPGDEDEAMDTCFRYFLDWEKNRL